MLDDFKEHGPVLAVVDGRFLPVDFLSISTDKEAKTIQRIGGDTLDMTTRASTIDVGIRTRRRPHIRDLAGQNVYIRNRKYKITVTDPHVTTEGANMDDFQPTYDIELTADSYSVTTSSETF